MSRSQIGHAEEFTRCFVSTVDVRRIKHVSSDHIRPYGALLGNIYPGENYNYRGHYDPGSLERVIAWKFPHSSPANSRS